MKAHAWILSSLAICLCCDLDCSQQLHGLFGDGHCWGMFSWNPLTQAKPFLSWWFVILSSAFRNLKFIYRSWLYLPRTNKGSFPCVPYLVYVKHIFFLTNSKHAGSSPNTTSNLMPQDAFASSNTDQDKLYFPPATKGTQAFPVNPWKLPSPSLKEKSLSFGDLGIRTHHMSAEICRTISL